MAKFGAYFALCPIIDNKSLLGISEDVEKGNVIVTLGKNIAVKYKLSNQKQLTSWRTKEKFTSPVHYYKEQSKYVAVFNKTFIRLWSGAEDENIDKLKKYKFNNPIKTLIKISENVYVVFENGATYSLSTALDLRKTLNPVSVIDESEILEDVLYSYLDGNTYIGLITKSEDYSLYWSCTNDFKEIPFPNKLVLVRDSCSLMGYVFHNEMEVNFLTIWSDGKIFSRSMHNSYEDTLGELFAVVESITTKHPVSLAPLNENYLAIFGANINEEGALLIIYNTQFKVNQTKQTFKLYTNGVKLWCIDSNLMLPVGQNLAVVPFHLETEQLAALVGSHNISTLDPDISIVEEFEFGSWNNKIKIKNEIPKNIKNIIGESTKRGLPECTIFENLLPAVFEKNNVTLLASYLNYFYDVSEKSIAQILKFLLKLESMNFSSEVVLDAENVSSDMQPQERINLIDIILTKPFSDVLIAPHLRIELDVDNVLLLLDYICFMFSEDGHCLPNMNDIETENKLINWGCILIDSNYQKFLLTKDPTIKNVLIKFNNFITDELKCFTDLNLVEPILRQFSKGKSLVKQNFNCGYSVEQLSLY